MRNSFRSVVVLFVAFTVIAAACSSDDASDGSADTDAATTTPSSMDTDGATTTAGGSATTEDDAVTTSTAPVGEGALDVRGMVEALAADEMNGRDNQTPGSEMARELLVAELSQFAEPAYPDAAGDEGYLQPYDVGTNILAVIPGEELPDEYVMIGAHYDHHGNNCDDITEDDNICNGANDNAAGVAAAMHITRSIAAEGPRRSVIVALWDGEEDGLIGSGKYVEDPAVPLDQTVAYVNFDIQGANLLPSLSNATILVGAETGGPNLVDSSRRATEVSTLDTVMLSLLFGQGRSDHAVLVEAGIPSVFFTDANNGCYHTVKDDIDAVDFAKLDQQILTADALSRDLIATDDVPALDTAAPPSTYDDAAELLRIISMAEPDFALFGAEQQASSEQYLADLQAVVDAGAEAFNDEANAILLAGAVEFVSSLAAVDCDPYIS